MLNIKGKYTEATIMIDNVEESCIKQIQDMCNHEAFTNPITIMPDCHSGKGSVIGFTMPVGDKIVPNVIGVDISCGVLSFNIEQMEIDHEDFDKRVRESIPFGMNINKETDIVLSDELIELCKRIGADVEYTTKSIGSVGSGNHFIELGRSEKTGDIWISIHSGSRNLGKKVCEYWQNIASHKDIMDTRQYLEEVIKPFFPKEEWNKKIKEYKEKINNVVKSDLDYLEGKDKDGYLHDMKLCQEYAKLNRYTIMNKILSILDYPIVLDIIETVHNYIDFDDKIIRKGSIKSYEGKKMCIPLNMRDGMLICEGKSNPDWNFSAPHGAGRVLSRAVARKLLDLNKFKDDMSNVFSNSVCYETIDESPDAYKDSKVIEKAIEPTAKILDRIIPIHNMKDRG